MARVTWQQDPVEAKRIVRISRIAEPALEFIGAGPGLVTSKDR